MRRKVWHRAQNGKVGARASSGIDTRAMNL